MINTHQSQRNQWESFTREFPELDDIVDRTANIESLKPIEMQNKLIRLYQTYVAEWFDVESQICEFLVNKPRNLQERVNPQVAIATL